MSRFWYLGCALAFLFKSLGIAQTTPLPSLSIDANRLSISGYSSGGSMAHQMFLASEWKFSGIGTFGATNYACGEGGLATARECMTDPDFVSPTALANRARELSSTKKIPLIARLRGTKLYLFHGRRDSVVDATMSELISSFYMNLLETPPTLKIRIDRNAEHGIPTVNQGEPCNRKSSNGLLNCGYDGIGEMLAFIRGPLNSAASPRASNLLTFDQSEFAPQGSSLASTGRVYIPTACKNGGCALHIALHGCLLAGGDAFYSQTSYNAWAEANRLVVLYPEVSPSSTNSDACWDWWGYTGKDYLTMTGKQVRALDQMVHRLSSGRN